MAEPKRTPSLLAATSVGTAWMIGGQTLRQLVHLFFRILLARLLSPDDFGQMAMAVVLLTFSHAIGDFGIGRALVQKKDGARTLFDTAFWTSLGIGAALFLFVIAIAPLLALFFAEPGVTGLARLLAAGVLFEAVATTFVARLQQQLNFRPLGLAGVFSVAVGGLAGVQAANAGAGARALAVYTVVASAVYLVVVVLAARWRPALSWSADAFRELWQYGKYLTGVDMLLFVARVSDRLLIGKFLGSVALGHYALSYQGVVLPAQYVSRPAARVLFSAMSELRGDSERLQRAFLHSAGALMGLLWPGITVLALAAPALVPQVLGERWVPAVPVLSVLCLAALFRSTLYASGAVFQSIARTDLFFRVQLANALLMMAGILGGLRWGVLGVAVGFVAASAVYLPLQILTMSRAAGFQRRALARVYVGSFVAMIPTVAIEWWLLRLLSPERGLQALVVSLVVACLGGYLVFLVCNPHVRRSLQMALAGLRSGAGGDA